MLPAEFTGQIAIECYRGGVTKVDTKTIRQAPKAVAPVVSARHAFSA